MGKNNERNISEVVEEFSVGRAIKRHRGNKISIISTGTIAGEVQKACEILSLQGINPSFYTFPTIKPIDKETVKNIAADHEILVTAEEHNIIGGLGGAVAEIIAEISGKKAVLRRIGLNDCYTAIVGSQEYLRKQHGLAAVEIAGYITKLCKENMNGQF